MHTEIFKYNQHSSFVFYVYMILRMTVLKKLTTLSGMGMAQSENVSVGYNRAAAQ